MTARAKANASRYHTWTAERVEAVLRELETEIGKLLGEAATVDADESTLRDDHQASVLPPELADANARKEKLNALLKELREADAARKKDGIKSPAQLPKADTDSRVMPNKEGGYAPNRTDKKPASIASRIATVSANRRKLNRQTACPTGAFTV